MRIALASLLCSVLAALVVSFGHGNSTASADLSLPAAFATITVDGDDSDWDSIEGLSVTLKQFEIPSGSEWEYDPLDPVEAQVKAATDGDRFYLLFKVFDDYDWDPDDSNLSGSPNVMFLIDQLAGPHMGSGDEDFEESLGMVDIWHWELECGPGVMSGGGDAGTGNDPDCNLDDEFATDPEERDDDGKGDAPNTNGENSLAGSWDHTGRAGGTGSEGAWVFEYSRPLQTGDPEDAQFGLGSSTFLALAYFDADESRTGWSDAGHLTSADAGWLEVLLPSGQPTATPVPTGSQDPTATPEPTASPESTPTPAAPGPDDSEIEAEVTVSDEPRVGEPSEIRVVLRHAEDGSPVPDVKVRVLQDKSFMDVEGVVELIGARTDEDGVAVMTFIPRRPGEQELLIEYLLPEAIEPASTTASLMVADGGQIFQSEAGVNIPGLGVWAIFAVITTVWALLLLIAARVIAVARAGGVPPPGAPGYEGRLTGGGLLEGTDELTEPGPLDEADRLDEPGTLGDD